MNRKFSLTHTVMDWLGVRHVASQMRHFCAQPQEALGLLLGKLSR
jgi:hypothetical protein